MKKSLLCSMAVMSLSVFATSPIYPQIEGVAEIDETIRCVNNLEISAQVSMTQSMHLQTHVSNLTGYKVNKLINDTPKIKELSQKLSQDYGIDVDFSIYGLGADTTMAMLEHEKNEEIFALYNAVKSEIDSERKSVMKLINRNIYTNMGIGYPGYAGYNTSFTGGFPGNGGFGLNIGTLDVYYDLHADENENNIELQYNAYFNDFVVQSAADANDEMEGQATVSSVIDVKSVNFEIKMNNPYMSGNTGGWGSFNKYQVVDADTGEEVSNTNDPYEVCRAIAAKKSRVFDASISTTELTPEKDGEFILTGGDAAGASVTLE
ncbi:MAG: hypothetical protein CME62_10850 [Halobacteriovoraceae bacterium]|nr:hypothetical protein [Halobacteriovoraceae bacterium]|tara:strand:- start:4340 stop:5299 length:960 start_codon:yes stop_codon:yes gene_type:complete